MIIIMCLNPIKIFVDTPLGKVSHDVPCGHCLECAKDKQNEYCIRTWYESKKWSTGWFFTLTYSDDNVPTHIGCKCDYQTGEVYEENFLFHDLDSSDIQNWKKRCRRFWDYHYGDVPKFSFLICGEYGPRTHRPHYHGLIFGLTKVQFVHMMHDWQVHHGFTQWSALKWDKIHEASRYVSKYLCKADCFEFADVRYGECPKPRKIVSPYYGFPRPCDLENKDLPYVKEFQSMRNWYNCLDLLPSDDLPSFEDYCRILPLAVNRLTMIYNGYKYKLPRYYVTKFFYEKMPDGSRKKNELRSLVCRYLRIVHERDLLAELEQYYLQQADLPDSYVSPWDFISLKEKSDLLLDADKENSLYCKSASFFAHSFF